MSTPCVCVYERHSSVTFRVRLLSCLKKKKTTTTVLLYFTRTYNYGERDIHYLVYFVYFFFSFLITPQGDLGASFVYTNGCESVAEKETLANEPTWISIRDLNNLRGNSLRTLLFASKTIRLFRVEF